MAPKLERLSPGDRWPSKASFFNIRADAIEQAGKMAVGGAIQGNQGKTNGMTVEKPVKLVLFELTEDMQMPDPTGVALGDSTVPFTENAQAVWYTLYQPVQDYAADDTYTGTLYHPQAIQNTNDIAVGHPTFFAGDKVWATFVNGRWDIISEVTRVWRFELKDALTPGGNATAYLLDSAGAEDTDQEFEVYDQVFGDMRAPIGAKGYAKFFADSERWEILRIQRQATKCKGLVKGATTSPTSFTVDNVVNYNGLSPVASAATELTVVNTFSDDADDNAVISFSWNETDDQWETDDIKCPA